MPPWSFYMWTCTSAKCISSSVRSKDRCVFRHTEKIIVLLPATCESVCCLRLMPQSVPFNLVTIRGYCASFTFALLIITEAEPLFNISAAICICSSVSCLFISMCFFPLMCWSCSYWFINTIHLGQFILYVILILSWTPPPIQSAVALFVWEFLVMQRSFIIT